MNGLQSNLVHDKHDEEVDIPNENALEDSEDEQNVNNEYLVSVVDALSSDLEYVLSRKLEPDFLEYESETTNFT